MEQALYRKYRSRTFSQVVGQDHITKTLQRAIKSGRISHAYLFTGPRGVGKTSVARILAHEVNQLAYKDDAVHLDIIEIDAASNRRIDEIRDLRERVRIAPAAAKYKVYIIDEVHMLTREAFNALLKTLEEPPAHCIFILATTEAHKLPETIISRTQRFEFKPVGTAQAAAHLQTIAKHEKITIDQAALELLAEFGSGSFRDSISYLDQLSSAGKEITQKEVREMLGLPSDREISAIISGIASGDSGQVLRSLSVIKDQGVSPAAAASALAKDLRALLVSGQADSWIAGLLKQLIEVPASYRPYDSLEVVVLEAAANNSRPAPEIPKAKLAPANIESQPAVTSKPVAKDSQEVPNNADFSLELWPEIVNSAKSQAASIYTALRLAQPSYADGVLTLAFQFPLHQKKLDQAKNKDMLNGLIAQFCGSAVRIECTVEKSDPQPLAAMPASPPAPLKAISSIFGTAEVLEA